MKGGREREGISVFRLLPLFGCLLISVLLTLLHLTGFGSCSSLLNPPCSPPPTTTATAIASNTTTSISISSCLYFPTWANARSSRPNLLLKMGKLTKRWKRGDGKEEQTVSWRQSAKGSKTAEKSRAVNIWIQQEQRAEIRLSGHCDGKATKIRHQPIYHSCQWSSMLSPLPENKYTHKWV